MNNIFHLETIKSTQNGFEQLAQLAACSISQKAIDLDFSNCNFFDANLSATLAVVLCGFKEIQLSNIPHEIKDILCRNNFLPHYGYPPCEDKQHTTLPYQCFPLSAEIEFSKYLDCHLIGRTPKMSEKALRMFKEKIFEVFQNSKMHSDSNMGIFVCGQFYPSKKQLDLTISDYGVGIRTKVRKYLTNKVLAAASTSGTKIAINDFVKYMRMKSIDAIKWALEDGNTTKQGLEPGGLGLKFLKEFVNLNQGKLQIISRHGFYQYKKDHEDFNEMSADLPGTTVNIEVNTDDDKFYYLSSENN